MGRWILQKLFHGFVFPVCFGFGKCFLIFALLTSLRNCSMVLCSSLCFFKVSFWTISLHWLHLTLTWLGRWFLRASSVENLLLQALQRGCSWIMWLAKWSAEAEV